MKKVLILYGGNSPEHDISKKSAKTIYENIDKKLFNVDMIYITKNNEWLSYNTLEKIKNIPNKLKEYDIVFPLTHGKNGEDGKLQGFLDLFNIKYVGSKTLSSAISMDKAITKIILDKYNIPNVPYLIIKDKYKIKNIEKLGYPLIIKPANNGSSIGINKANNRKELVSAIEEAKKYDNKIIIEKFIKARELECAILENKKIITSEIGEIISCNEFYDYDAKYEKNSQIIIPAKINKNIKKSIQKISKDVFKILECKTYARIDFLLSDTGILYLNEINTLPGFTNISMYPSLFELKKISIKKLITFLINNELQKNDY